MLLHFPDQINSLGDRFGMGWCGYAKHQDFQNDTGATQEGNKAEFQQQQTRLLHPSDSWLNRSPRPRRGLSLSLSLHEALVQEKIRIMDRRLLAACNQ